MDEQRSKLLKVALVSGSFAIIVVGLAVALAGEWFGWLIAAFGALDAASIPFVLRAIGARQPPSPPGGQSEPDPIADPSTNPYARED